MGPRPTCGSATRSAPRRGTADEHHFAPPTLETVVVPRRAADKGALRVALDQLAEQDPLINLRQDDLRQEIAVSLYGEVQKEVIQATLADDFGIDVAFRETTTICIERPVGTGAAVRDHGRRSQPVPRHVGLRVDPAPIGAGVTFRLEVELGSMPYAFFRAVEEAAHETLQQGLHGWQVTDCAVTMTHSGYSARQSHCARDVRQEHVEHRRATSALLTPLVLMSALRQAGTTVYEPMHRFRLELPGGCARRVAAGARRARRHPGVAGDPRRVLHAGGRRSRRRACTSCASSCPALTRGEGVLESEFLGYQPVRGAVPSRPRTDRNPLDREAYLRVSRR